ncbi:hypothetical protein [Candidatus Enterococcus murrayae]|uniref:Uncharacterized protein n=1 Tax=Candidatus Enterococcus murrayae TaxID=2815321 RepID=A0ABS3HED7_9ENTE|nr:hypothetical protein [Enterococcus sp. MJM16]MBO0451824.1 hypothetical protein [Enterococcus sp. MJM16]
MSIQVWIGLSGGLGILSLGSFLYFFMKDSRLRLVIGKKSTTLLLDCGLLFISIAALVAAVLLYLDWQEQLAYFLNR